VFTKNDNGVWEFSTTAPAPPGAFRYAIQVDGVRTLDPVNTRISESNTATWSLFDVPGLEAADLPAPQATRLPAAWPRRVLPGAARPLGRGIPTVREDQHLRSSAHT
jgi:hypothetical protein